MSPSIFLSYRRSDTSGYAGRLAASLGRHFGTDRVFQDMTSKQAKFEHLVNAYSSWLYRYAYWITGDRTVAEDLLGAVIKALSEEPAQQLKRAERLGFWFAAAGSTKTLFDMMGFTV